MEEPPMSERLWAHKTSGKTCFKKVRYFHFEKTGGKERAEQRERAEINAYEDQYGILRECNKRRISGGTMVGAVETD